MRTETFKSSLSGVEFSVSERVVLSTVREDLYRYIQKLYPSCSPEGEISISELNVFREKYITDYLLSEGGSLSELENTVLDSLKENELLTDKIEEEETLTLSQRLSDKVAEFGGSWWFIISFLFFMLIWICSNVYLLANKGFDPYPFILLNLILSCVAALQAPIIMMSQNRQEEKDRERAKKDYMINLKSELEIRLLHEKIDHLILNQQRQIFEINKKQLEILEEIKNKKG